MPAVGQWVERITELWNMAAWEYMLLPCVFFGGLYFTVRTGAIQLTKLGYILRRTTRGMLRKNSACAGALTPRQALTTALSSTVGTGNIIGTGQAIAMGGCGAVFWLWIAALLGMIVKYSEVLLAVCFRRRNQSGEWVGGPMYYITDGMGSRFRPLAILFCVLAIGASFGIGNLSQVSAIVQSACAAMPGFSASQGHWLRPVMGIFLAGLTALILFGGAKRIASATERLVPAMSLLYILLCMAVIVLHADQLFGVLGKIVAGAFCPQAIAGASSGITLRQCVLWGLRRSAFSNEAGLGSAAIAHAGAQSEGCVQQGMYGVFEVFADTIVLCTLTALAILCGGAPIVFGQLAGTEPITEAFASVFGGQMAAVFVAVCMILFAFSTILGWSLYGIRCWQYLFGERTEKIYILIFTLMTAVGAVLPSATVWQLADTLNAMMAGPNYLALFALGGTVAAQTRTFFNGQYLVERKGDSSQNI